MRKEILSTAPSPVRDDEGRMNVVRDEAAGRRVDVVVAISTSHQAQISSGTMVIAPQGHSCAHKPQPLQ